MDKMQTIHIVYSIVQKFNVFNFWKFFHKSKMMSTNCKGVWLSIEVKETPFFWLKNNKKFLFYIVSLNVQYGLLERDYFSRRCIQMRWDLSNFLFCLIWFGLRTGFTLLLSILCGAFTIMLRWSGKKIFAFKSFNKYVIHVLLSM